MLALERQPLLAARDSLRAFILAQLLFPPNLPRSTTPLGSALTQETQGQSRF
jgi:hypothetical protein